MHLENLSLVNRWVEAVIVNDGSIVLITNSENLTKLVVCFNFLFNTNYSTLMDIWGVDYPHSPLRFEVNYLLLNFTIPHRLIFRSHANEYTGLSTISSLFYSAGWLEREVWDMYGVFFNGHNDLRRILTDYGFSGFPLRKDFPLTGYSEVRYDDSSKQVVLEPLEVSQEFSLFNFNSPWENNYLD